MISWGLEVNDYGNAILNEDGSFIKVAGQGMTEAMWQEMVAYADKAGLKGGNYKKLNLPFENKLLGQSRDVRDRMVKRVESFVFDMLTTVFNAADTADIAIDAMLTAGSYDAGPKAGRIEDPNQWTPEKIAEKAASLGGGKGPKGNFDD
jgi:hypothetical protein